MEQLEVLQEHITAVPWGDMAVQFTSLFSLSGVLLRLQWDPNPKREVNTAKTRQWDPGFEGRISSGSGNNGGPVGICRVVHHCPLNLHGRRVQLTGDQLTKSSSTIVIHTTDLVCLCASGPGVFIQLSSAAVWSWLIQAKSFTWITKGTYKVAKGNEPAF